MPDFFGVYDDMKVTEYLEFFAAAYRITGPERPQEGRPGARLRRPRLQARRARHEPVSRGMTQRLGLARVLLHDPQVLLLDEPASGLDPRARIEMRELIKGLRQMNKTIMVSSHILPELADICNKIGIIERGKLICQRHRRGGRSGRCAARPVFTVSVGDRNDEAADEDRAPTPRSSRSSPTRRPASLDVRLKDGHEDGSFLPERLIAAGFRLQASRRRNEHRGRVHADHEGDHELTVDTEVVVTAPVSPVARTHEETQRHTVSVAYYLCN